MGTSMNASFHNTTSRDITTISPVGVQTPKDMSVCAPFSLHDIFSSSLKAVKGTIEPLISTVVLYHEGPRNQNKVEV